jgi:cytochrome c-type biogenesis protein CcmH/NrfG
VGSSFRLFLVLALAGSLRADPDFDRAVRLYGERQYPEARAALERITAARPQDAAACYYLGMTLRHRGDPQALDAAVVWLEKAVALAPANAAYLGDYGGTCLELADQHHSFTFATRGRSAMEKAILLNPDNLDARQGLMQFYARAPWPLGSSARARTQADEILRRDPARGLRAFLVLGRALEKAGNRSEARAAYAIALQLSPASAEAAAGAARLTPILPK